MINDFNWKSQVSVYLLITFSFLFLVCKRWKEVALSLWSSETSLTYEQIRDITQDFEKINIQHFESVLTRCKNHLTSLDLNQRGLYFPEESDANTIIFLIFTLLKNLKHLIVNGGLFTKTVLHWLEKEKSFCPNLESFKITRKTFMLY